MNLINRKAKHITGVNSAAVAAQRTGNHDIFKFSPSPFFEFELYDSLRTKLPILDACIGKIVRLTGGFRVIAEDENYQNELDRFCEEISVNLSGNSVQSFIDNYFDSLLTYGRAVGEILIDKNTMQVSGLYNADSTLIKAKPNKSNTAQDFYIIKEETNIKIQKPEFILYSTLNPTSKHPEGVSILRGLPCMTDILLRIYECIGQNFDRVGNVRYAVNYKPSQDAGDKAFAKERAMQIAKEWSDGMNASRNGVVKDFVAVGDVEIKVIGAENQLINTEIPVRQLLEQIISKLSIPPFLLGLNWSSTERMSTQQADILTSELEYYRRLLTPVIKKITQTYLRLLGVNSGVTVEWDNINLQDECELAQARLYNAQAHQLELENEKTI